jgi:hypothetical protein
MVNRKSVFWFLGIAFGFSWILFALPLAFKSSPASLAQSKQIFLPSPCGDLGWLLVLQPCSSRNSLSILYGLTSSGQSAFIYGPDCRLHIPGRAAGLVVSEYAQSMGRSSGSRGSQCFSKAGVLLSETGFRCSSGWFDPGSGRLDSNGRIPRLVGLVKTTAGSIRTSNFA